MKSAWQRPLERPGIRQSLGAALVMALCSCGGGSDEAASRMSVQGGISGSGSGKGTMAIALADAPACGFDAVYVTVEKLRFNLNASAGAGSGGWVELGLPSPVRVDLLTLTGGTAMSLGAFGVPAGTYTQMRIVLAPNDPAHPLANSVVPTGGVETALATPSAQGSGFKVDVAMAVPAGGVASYVIDLDACQSVMTNVHSGQYWLNPVIQVVAASASAGRPGSR